MPNRRGNTVYTNTLVDQIQRELGLERSDILDVLSSLSSAVGKALAQGHDVNIEQLGTFRPYKTTGHTRPKEIGDNERVLMTTPAHRVSFRKSKRLKEIFQMAENTQEEGMDKYAVSESAGAGPHDLEKQAANGCPLCGRSVTIHGNVLLCPVHGSEPFEG